MVEGRNRDEGKNAKEQKRKEVDQRGTEEMMRGRRERESKGQGWKEEGEGEKVAMRGRKEMESKGQEGKEEGRRGER